MEHICLEISWMMCRELFARDILRGCHDQRLPPQYSIICAIESGKETLRMCREIACYCVRHFSSLGSLIVYVKKNESCF